MYKYTISLVFLLILIVHLSVISGSYKDIIRQTAYPPCKACKIFIESFKRGVERTAKGKFDGGDTAWEEEKLGSYATSEIRLVEIQEKVCSDVEEGRNQCYLLHEHFDHDIEEWWLNYQHEHPDLLKYFCIEKLKHCCPDLHYGPYCLPCPGFPDSVCFNNGRCIGNGTRKGNGRCACDAGYTGEMCNICDKKFLETYRDETKLLCSPCPKSCAGDCSKSGCEKCAPGWLKTEKGACIDIDECAAKNAPCNTLEFCVNVEGGFDCLKCDRSCGECTGDGPDMCTRCARGFSLIGNMCIDETQEERKNYIYYTRMLTYVGLCLATCITYQKNVIVAAVIGLSVAIYITISEYVINAATPMNTTDVTEPLDLND